MRDAEDVTTIELKVAEATVGRLRMRARERAPDASLLRLVTTLIASEVERVRAPERASEEAATSFQRAVLDAPDRATATISSPAARSSAPISAAGGSVVVVRAHPRSPTEDDWRRRLLAVAGARRALDRARLDRRAAARTTPARSSCSSPTPTARPAAASAPRSCASSSPACRGFAFAIGRSRRAEDPLDLHRAGNEALLAANVVEGDPERSELAYEETGTYQLLLPHMNDPAELKRFYSETVRPLVAYDEQYETDLLGTLSTFLDCDANVNATAARLITHRHTIRYRFERVRELTGLDVSSTDGREKLSLGLKAMRVLGIAAPRGPATEPGAEGGRVPR